MMSIDFIAEFDPFFADYIQRYGNSGHGYISYLSSTICDEIIKLLSEQVKRITITDIKQAKYFSRIVDSFADIFACS